MACRGPFPQFRAYAKSGIGASSRRSRSRGPRGSQQSAHRTPMAAFRRHCNNPPQSFRDRRRHIYRRRCVPEIRDAVIDVVTGSPSIRTDGGNNRNQASGELRGETERAPRGDVRRSHSAAAFISWTLHGHVRRGCARGAQEQKEQGGCPSRNVTWHCRAAR